MLFHFIPRGKVKRQYELCMVVYWFWVLNKARFALL